MALQFALKRGLRHQSGRLFYQNNHYSLAKNFRCLTTSTTTAQDTQHSKLKSFHDLPGPLSLPIIGSLPYILKHTFGKDFNKAMLEMQFQSVKDFGRIHKLKVPGFLSPVVQVADPNEVSKIFHPEPKYPKRIDIPVFEDFMEERKKIKGVFFGNGHDWYRHRKAIGKKMLIPKNVAFYAPMVNEVVTDFMSKLDNIRAKPGSEFEYEVKDLNRELFKWAFESICYLLLEKRFGCLSKNMNEDAQHFIRAINEVNETVFPVTILPNSLYKYYQTKAFKKFIKSLEEIYKYAEIFIDRKIEELRQQGKFDAEPNSSENNVEKNEVGFFEFLIAKGNLSREDIVASVIDLLFAGVETTSNTILWSLYMLGKNPDKQELLHNEVTSVLKPGEIPTVENINNMPYLKAWIKETLRLYPVLQSNTRLLQDDVEIGGYLIPAGTHVQTFSYFMCRDESVFKDATQFIPDRWLRDSDNHGPGVLHAHASLPFGFGKRMCVGRRIAELEMHLLLSRIVQVYEVLYPHCDNVEPETRGAIVPDRDVRVKFIKRQ